MSAGRRRRQHRALDDVVLVDHDRRQPNNPDHSEGGPIAALAAWIAELIRDAIPDVLPKRSGHTRRQGDLVECIEPWESTFDHRRPVLREEPPIEAPEHPCVPEVVDHPAVDNRERVEANIRRAGLHPRKARDRINALQIRSERVDRDITQLYVTLIRGERRRRQARPRKRRQSEPDQHADRQRQRPDRPPGAALRPPREDRSPQRKSRQAAECNGSLPTRSTVPSSPADPGCDSRPAVLAAGVLAPSHRPATALPPTAPTHTAQLLRRPSSRSALKNLPNKTTCETTPTRHNGTSCSPRAPAMCGPGSAIEASFCAFHRAGDAGPVCLVDLPLRGRRRGRGGGASVGDGHLSVHRS